MKINHRTTIMRRGTITTSSSHSTSTVILFTKHSHSIMTLLHLGQCGYNIGNNTVKPKMPKMMNNNDMDMENTIVEYSSNDVFVDLKWLIYLLDR
jgi:hypothetical protein